MASILASANLAEKAGEILIAGSLLIASFLALGLGLWYYRRWRGETESPSTAPWTLDDLRKLREQGKLTESEYQKLRDAVIGAFTGQTGGNGSEASRQVNPPRDEEQWDWVAEDDAGSGGFDVKK